MSSGYGNGMEAAAKSSAQCKTIAKARCSRQPIVARHPAGTHALCWLVPSLISRGRTADAGRFWVRPSPVHCAKCEGPFWCSGSKPTEPMALLCGLLNAHWSSPILSRKLKIYLESQLFKDYLCSIWMKGEFWASVRIRKSWKKILTLQGTRNLTTHRRLRKSSNVVIS